MSGTLMTMVNMMVSSPGCASVAAPAAETTITTAAVRAMRNAQRQGPRPQIRSHVVCTASASSGPGLRAGHRNQKIGRLMAAIPSHAPPR
jgi:hypothetical protein